ncbi:hypothetical protein MPER_07961, partial [Moniliophthora perniciosa FA553]
LTSDDSYNGFELPAGSVIIPNSWALLHDPDVYGADVDVFNPERFLTEDGKLNPELSDQVAFGYGRRALQTLYINIATILTVFEISSSGATPSGKYTTGLLRWAAETILQPKYCGFAVQVTWMSGLSLVTLESRHSHLIYF